MALLITTRQWILCVLLISLGSITAWTEPIQAENDNGIPENQLAAWVKLGTLDYGYYDLDGKVSANQTATIDGFTIFEGLADSDVASLGSGTVKALAVKYYHDHVDPIEDYGIGDGASLGMMAETVKPFTITSDTLANGTTTACTINTVYGGIIVLQEEQGTAEDPEFSSGQVDYGIEITTGGTGDDAEYVVTTNNDEFCYFGQLRIEDEFNGETHTYTIDAPNTCINVDFPEEADENYWDEDNGGLLYLTIAEVDPADPSSFTIIQGSLTEIPADIQAAITADYSDTGNKIYYVVFNKTTTFNATIGQTYWVSMDMQAAAQTSKCDNGIENSFNGDDTLAVCDFSHTILYAMSVTGAEVRTLVEIEEADVFGAGNVELDGTVLRWTDDVDLANSIELLNGNETTFYTNSYDGSVGAITGTGGLLKSGAGTLTLDEDCTFTGDTTVNAGGLVINGDFASDVLIEGGWLGGDGILAGDLDLTGGSLKPGNSIGTITVDNITLDGGTLEVELDDSGNADLVIATTADLVSGTIQAAPTEAITGTLDYTIIQTSGSITGDPADLDKAVTDRSFLVDFDLSLSGNDLILTARQTRDFSETSASENSGNLGGIATLLQDAADNSLGGQELADLQMLNENELNSAMEQLQPQTYQGASQVLGNQANAVHASTLGRINTLQFASRQSKKGLWDYALADAGNGRLGEVLKANEALSQMNDGKWIGYSRSLNDWGEIDGDSNAGEYRWETHGVDVGAETFANENTLIGFSIAALWSSVHGFDGSGSSNITSLYGNLYGSWFNDDGHIDAGLSYGHAWTKTRRPIIPLALRAKGDYESDIYSMFVGGGLFYDIQNYEIEPFVVYNYTLRSDGGCKESGAGALNLDVQRNDTDSLRQTLGVRISRLYTLSNGSAMRPYVSAAWDYEYLNNQVVGSVDLLGSTFSNSGIEIDRSSGVFSGGLDWYIKSNISFFADYTATLNSDMVIHSTNAGVRITF